MAPDVPEHAEQETIQQTRVRLTKQAQTHLKRAKACAGILYRELEHNEKSGRPWDLHSEMLAEVAKDVERNLRLAKEASDVYAEYS